MGVWDRDLTLDSEYPPYARPSTTPCLVRIVEYYQNPDKKHRVDLWNVCWFENTDADVNPKKKYCILWPWKLQDGHYATN
jgi:hypothetical protein